MRWGTGGKGGGEDVAHVVDPCFSLQAADHDRLQEIQRAHDVDLESVFRCGKRLADVRLRGEVVDLVRLDVAEQLNQNIRVGDIALVDGDFGLNRS